MTPVEIFEYKNRWLPNGYSITIHSDWDIYAKGWVKEKFEKHEWIWKEYTDVYRSTYHFEHLNHAKSFFKYLDSEHPRCTKEFLDSWEVKPKELS